MHRPNRIALPLVALALAFAAALPSAAAAAPGARLTVARGTVPNSTGGFPWVVTVARAGVAGIPGLCLAADHSWNADGSSFGNVSTRCVAGSVGGRFSLHASRCRGVFAAIGRASAGADTIRKLAFAVDRRARRLRIAFPGGGRATVRTARAPRALRLPVRVAWLVDGGSAFPRSVVAHDGRGRVVGRWKAGSRC